MITLNGTTYKLKYKKSITGSYMTREVTLYHNNENIGHFTIEGQYNPKTGYKNTHNYFNSGNTCSMTINIDDSYHRRGLSPILINHMIHNIEKYYPKIRDDQYLYIDADGSAGFWNSIGMKEHEFSFDTTPAELEGEGYEKRITFKELKQYVDRQLSKDKYKNMYRRTRKRVRSPNSPKSLSRSRNRSSSRSRSNRSRSNRSRSRSRSNPSHSNNSLNKH